MNDIQSSPDDFATAFESAFARLQLLVLEACEDPGPSPRRAAAGIRAALEFAATDPAAARALTVDAWAQGASGIARHQRLIEHFAELLAAGRAERPADAAPLPEITERALVGGLARLIAERLDRGREGELTALAPEATQFVLTPYLGTEEARRVALSGAG
jgi:hypothetical protein